MGGGALFSDPGQLKGYASMIQENEFVTFILGLCTLLYLLSKVSRIREFPMWKPFAAIYLFYFVGWSVTILEDIWGDFAAGAALGRALNATEHVCYAAGSLLLTIWCLKVLRTPARGRRY